MLNRFFILFILVVILAPFKHSFGQAQKTSDSLVIKPNTEIISTDTNKKVKQKKSKLETKIDYKAQDSIRFKIGDKKVYLYGNAVVNYGEINLKAAYIIIDFDKNIVNATYVLDSNKKEIGVPEFTEGSETFKAKELAYNFDTKKGFIKKIFTQEGDGFMHGNLVKKEPDNTVLVKNGAYTTCNLEHPHFAIKFDKAKVIPNDKIVTGPAYLSVEDVPTPLMIPFGFFPNVKGQKNGILIPSYGNSANRGYFLEKGGYYIGLGDKMDLQLKGTIYSRGSFGLNGISTYNKKYKYNGNLSVNYSYNRLGEKGASDYSVSKDFLINWQHSQDPKARPRSQFSANVNAGTSKYNKFNSYNVSNFMQNEMQSSISYRTSFGKVFNFSANFRHSQNNATKLINITLPDVVLSSNRIYPFKRQVAVGSKKWYENIGLNYTLNTKNEVTTNVDSLFMMYYTKNRMKNGVRHSIPISTNFKLGKYATLTPSMNLNERWYFDYITKNCVISKDASGHSTAKIVSDTMRGFKTAHDIDFNLNLTSKLYGLVQFKKGKINAIRHVITPNVGFQYRPDWFVNDFNFRSVQADTAGKVFQEYSIFQNGIFGQPYLKKSGAINASISNNLEMKVRTKKDTVTGFKKIMLIDDLTIATSYDFARDSLNLSPIRLSGRTKLFKNLDVTYNGYFDPYILDSTGLRNINKLEKDVNNRLVRLTGEDWNFNFIWNISSQKFSKKPLPAKPTIANTPENQQELENIKNNPDNYVDYTIPWNINVSYSMGRSKRYNLLTGNKKTITQSLAFSGDISLTKKWKIGYSTSFDLSTKTFVYPSIDIYRDLHCWEMTFHWIPTGFNKQFLFTIKVKSSVLQDLKLTKKNEPAWK
ncbi:MAG: putative LPS assembly protein LptD [Bacteroidota bacterium]